MRAAASLAAIGLLALLLAGACGGRQPPKAETTALIQFDSNVADAEVWVDGQFFAGALQRGIRVAPGEHRVAVQHDDYHTQYFELTVAAGERRTLEVRLAEILP